MFLPVMLRIMGPPTDEQEIINHEENEAEMALVVKHEASKGM